MEPTRATFILLVEDNEDDYEATRRAFERQGLANPVVWSRDGEEALEVLTRPGDLPNLILLDLNLPGMDGRDVLRRVKGDPKLSSIPVIVLTTSSDERDVESCYALGANSYVQKPVDLLGLLDAVRRLKDYWFELVVLPRATVPKRP